MENNFQIVANLSQLNSESGLKSSSSFIRVFFENSSTVIEKKQNSLRDALQKKFECRHIDFEECVVYDKNSKLVIDLDDQEIGHEYQDLVLKKKSEIEHRFTSRRMSIKDKLFSSRACHFCGKLSMLPSECQKCELIICQENACLDRSRISICLHETPKKNLRSKIKFSKSKFMAIARPAILKRKRREPQQNSDEQLSPTITALEFSPRIRIRSFSDPEISNMMANLKPTEQVKKEIKEQDVIEEETSSQPPSMSPSSLPPPISPPETPDTPTKSPQPKRLHRWSSLLNWEIPATRIKIHKHFKLGHGSFGVVHKGTDFYHGVVAVKFLNVAKPSPSQVAAFKNEVAILKSTRHDNILLFIGCFLNQQLAIVTEWCPGSSLYRHLHVEEVKWQMYQLVDIARQISTGMEYLHAKSILHRDLKSNNVFLVPNDNSFASAKSSYSKFKKKKWTEGASDESDDECGSEWTVKIGDFGLATVKSMNDDDDDDESPTRAKHNKRPTGSVLWMAPEVINQKVNDPYTQKSDVYSFGVVLYEMATSSLPFQNIQHKEPSMILFLVGCGKLKLDLNALRDDTPEDIKNIIAICSDYNRDVRPDFVEITKQLKKIRLGKPKEKKLERVQSTPNIYFAFQTAWTPSHAKQQPSGSPSNVSSEISSASSLASQKFFPPGFCYSDERVEIGQEMYLESSSAAMLANEITDSMKTFLN